MVGSLPLILVAIGLMIYRVLDAQAFGKADDNASSRWPWAVILGHIAGVYLQFAGLSTASGDFLTSIWIVASFYLW